MKKLFIGGMVMALMFSWVQGVSAADLVQPGGGGANNPPAPTATIVSPNVSTCKSLETGGLGGVVSCFLGFLNYALVVIMAVAVVYVVWGAFQLMREEKREEGKNIILYGIIGLFVMISIWGFVNILQSTFSLNNAPIPAPALTNAPK